LENKLRNLYSLQIVDNALDELEELKGDLPSQKRETEEILNALEEKRAERETVMKESFATREQSDNEIVELREKLERFKQQQHDVRNNREYDALGREMDHASARILLLEKEVHVLESRAVQAKEDITKLDEEIEIARKNLEEKDAALSVISKENEEEELKYRHERDKLLARIEKTHLQAYERIRQARRGRAIVPVKRGACGGCFAKVPPQRMLELRQNSRMYHCEHCGRIIVSDEIAVMASADA